MFARTRGLGPSGLEQMLALLATHADRVDVALAAVLFEDLSAAGRVCHPGQTRGAGFVDAEASNVEGGLGASRRHDGFG